MADKKGTALQGRIAREAIRLARKIRKDPSNTFLSSAMTILNQAQLVALFDENKSNQLLTVARSMVGSSDESE